LPRAGGYQQRPKRYPGMARGCLALLILSLLGPVTLVIAMFGYTDTPPPGSLLLIALLLGVASLSLAAYVVIGVATRQ
jgi:hypothetical protein